MSVVDSEALDPIAADVRERLTGAPEELRLTRMLVELPAATSAGPAADGTAGEFSPSPTFMVRSAKRSHMSRSSGNWTTCPECGNKFFALEAEDDAECDQCGAAV